MNIAHKKRSRRKRVMGILSVFVAAMTLYTLLLPAFTLEKEPLCGFTEHVHTESCYARELVCPLPEEGHTHNRDCYDADGILICALRECPWHVHTDECWEKKLICGLPEHVHTDACYADAGTDVENEDLWERTLPDISGMTPAEALTAVARSQLGYRESFQNFVVDENEKILGYTRYGAFYGTPYGEWSAAFVSFCLHYAGISAQDMPQDIDGSRMLDALANEGRFAFSPLPEETELLPGDLIFLTDPATGSVRAGIITGSDSETGFIDAIEGDADNAVRETRYYRMDSRIIGCGLLPAELRPAKTETAGDNTETADMPLMVFTGETESVSVRVEAPEGAFPAGTTMRVTDVDEQPYLETAAQAVEGSIKSAHAVDITFFDAEGNEIEPLIPISVEMHAARLENPENTQVIHIDDAAEAELVNSEAFGEAVVFHADEFSIYMLVVTELSTRFITASGEAYDITVTFGEDAGVPEGSKLKVSEIVQAQGVSDGATEYEEYLELTRKTLGLETSAFSYARFFDIKIADADGETVTITAPVDVKIRLADREENPAAQTRVVHFRDGAVRGDVIKNVEVIESMRSTEETAISFEAEGFSVYGIVDDVVESSAAQFFERAMTLDDLLRLGSEANGGVYIGHTSGYYFCNSTATSGGRTGIVKTIGAQSTPKISGSNAAAKYYFESAGENRIYAYCYSSNGTKQYVSNKGNNSLNLSANEADKTAFTVTVEEDGVFLFNNGSWYWNMQGGEGGSRFCSWNIAGDQNNKMYIWNQTAEISDPFGLDGATYTLLTWDGGKTGKALTADANSDFPGNLCADFLTVMTDRNDNSAKLFVPNNTSDNVTAWTFHWKGNYTYTLSTTDDNGTERYLRINADGSLSLTDNAEEAGEIEVTVPSDGIHRGQVVLKSGGKTLTYSGKYTEGFNTSGSAGMEYLYLAEAYPEDMLDGYYRTYTAQQISVSDPSLSPDSPDAEPEKVILYTRVWNGSRYEYFAIDGSGKLVPCSESGGEIEWIGSGLDELEWELTEYGSWDGDTFTPNKYYDLRNTYTGKYLAPQIEDQILSDSTIGLYLSGRTNGQYYTPVLAWDTVNYSYASILAEFDEQGQAVIEPCYRAEGMDIYFARIKELDHDDMMHTVPTVDNDLYGITMKIVDFTTEYTSNQPDGVGHGCSTSKEQTDVLGRGNFSANNAFHQTSGLLSTYLEGGPEGYPIAAYSSQSLGTLYSSSEEVNHLFIESTYQATGYYEYDSAQNFATLGKDGNFTVYQEIGTHDGGTKETLKHGQFLPYNDIRPGHFAEKNPRNAYNPDGTPMDPSNPRYNEQLYLVDNVNNYFGVELTAGFTQTPSGLDAWGHDIIFEFSGDDDFWLYVDGELVIDLGGVHSAIPGSVNFRTGKVNVNGSEFDLLDLFIENRVKRGECENTAAARAALRESLVYTPGVDTSTEGKLFVKKEEGGNTYYTFLDNTTHTMRIFYMERGAGASNLHMRFNLAAVKKGTVQLSKELDVNGVDMSSSTYAVFPYQIWFKDPLYDPDSTYHNVEYVQLTERNIGSGSVKYVGSTNDVTYKQELYVDNTNAQGIDCSVLYEDVYLVKPGEAIEITFPTFGDNENLQFVKDYYIVECGVDPNVYTEVSLDDGTPLTGTPHSTDIHVTQRDQNGDPVVPGGIETIPETDSGLQDFRIDVDTTDNRSKVRYRNNVEETEDLTIQKHLYTWEGEGHDPQIVTLYDADGNALDPANPDLETTFDFRVYFKTPYDTDYSPANVYEYHVKDPAGYYCRWVPADDTSTNPNAENSVGHFERITHNGVGVSDFNELTPDTIVNGRIVERGERSQATFDTSMNGSVSQIPAYYTVEICGLIPGTNYNVVERPTETPEGYRFWQYELNGVPKPDQDVWYGVEGVVSATDPSDVIVDNYKGYGLHLYKTWADASIMQDRDPAYFAVYYEDPVSGSQTLVDGSVRRLTYGDTQELYWFYLDLPAVNGTDSPVFGNYHVREVVLTGAQIVVGTDGTVSGYTDIAPVSNGGIMTHLNGTPINETPQSISYKVTYADPKLVGDNLREFRVTNTPSEKPPVMLLKEDWSGSALEGAKFTLAQGGVSIFPEGEKTSDSEGLIDIIYPSINAEYVLTETSVPQGYYGLQSPLTFQLVGDAENGWTLHVTPDSGDILQYYEVGSRTVEGENGEPTTYVTLTVKNRPYQFRAIKEDSVDQTPMKGVTFQLFERRTTSSGTGWSNDAISFNGSSDLITNENGIIPHLDGSLPAGTYQLREKVTPSGYQTIGNIDFTVSPTGQITLENHPDTVTLDGPVEGTGEQAEYLVFTLTVPNKPLPIHLIKVDESGAPLSGAKFTLALGTRSGPDNQLVWTVSDLPDSLSEYSIIDLTQTAEIDLCDFPTGFYRLEETTIPPGRILEERYIFFEIQSDRTVRLCTETGEDYPANGTAALVAPNADNPSYTIRIRNPKGSELPHSGGPGTVLFTVSGVILTAAALILPAGRMKRSPSPAAGLPEKTGRQGTPGRRRKEPR